MTHRFERADTMMTTCPHCHARFETTITNARALKPLSPRKAPLDYVADITTMTDDQLRAYRHQTAPFADALFFAHQIAGCGDYDLIAEAISLADAAHAGLARATVYQRLMRLQARWRSLEYLTTVRSDGVSVLVRSRANDLPNAENPLWPTVA